MRAQDVSTIGRRLAELADYYDKKPPGNSALRIWMDALEECGIDDVQAVLTDWPKAHRAMPLADEVLRACRLRMSDRVEQEAERNRRTQGSLRDLAEGLSRQSSAEAKQARAEIAEWARRRRDADPKGWARRLKAKEAAGEQLLPVQQAAWRKALREVA